MHTCWHGFSLQISSMPLFGKTVRPRPGKVSKPWDIASLAGRRKEQSCWHGFFRTHSINAIVPKNWCQRLLKRCLNAEHTLSKGTCRTCMGICSLLEGFSFCTAFCPSMLGFCLVCFAARGYASAGNSLRRALLGGSGTENAELLARVLHRAAFTQRRFTQRNFTRRSFYTEKLVHTEELFHTDVLTQRNFYTEQLLHTDTFTHRGALHT